MSKHSVADSITPLLLIAGMLGSGALALLSLGQHDYWAAVFFLLLFAGCAWLERQDREDPLDKVVDIESRRRRELGAAATLPGRR
jgi:hypothetical protein